MSAQPATLKTTMAKPQLRGAGKKAWTICLGLSLVTGAAFAVWYKTNILEPRKKQYIDFYNNWDDEKEFEAMRKAGVFKGFEE